MLIYRAYNSSRSELVYIGHNQGDDVAAVHRRLILPTKTVIPYKYI